MELPMKKWGKKMVVDWKALSVGSSMLTDNGETIEIVSNKQVEKIAKVSGNKRKERRLEVKIVGYNEVMEVGTESFKKQSWIKRYMKHATVVEPEVVEPEHKTMSNEEKLSLYDEQMDLASEYFKTIFNVETLAECKKIMLEKRIEFKTRSEFERRCLNDAYTWKITELKRFELKNKKGCA